MPDTVGDNIDGPRNLRQCAAYRGGHRSIFVVHQADDFER